MTGRLATVLILLAAVPVAAAPPVTALAVAPDGKAVLVGSQAGLDVRDGALASIRALPTEIPNLHDLAFAPDGKTLAVAGGAPGQRGLVEFFDWPGGRRLRSATVGRDCVAKIHWHSDGSTLLAAGGGSAVRLVDVATAKVTRTFEGHSKGVLAVAWLPGEASFASAGLDESVRLWNAKAGDVVRSFANHTRPVFDLAVRPGNGMPTVVSAGEDRTVRLWQPTIGRMVRFARLEVVPAAVAWTRDGCRIVVAGSDGRVRALDPETMDVLETVPALDGVAHALAVAPDGRVLVGGEGGQLTRVALAK